MAKKAGVPLWKNWIKRKASGPKPPEKFRLAKPEKPEVVLDDDSPEEGLEDTPVFFVQPVAPTAEVDSAEEKATQVETVPAGKPVGLSQTAGRRTTIRHAKKGWFSVTIQSVMNGIIRLFTGVRKKSKGNAAALAFAGSHHRLGKKGRRNRRVLIYAGSGLAVATVVLFVLLVPGGAAAPVDAPKTGVVANGTVDVTDSAAATDSTGGTVTATMTAVPTPSPTPVPTTVAEPTDNPIDMEELLEFFVVDADKYYNEFGYSNNHYNYTEDDVYMLAQVIYGEARGESRDGKIAVGNVVMNRVLCRRAWPNTISGVITAPGQFSGYKSTIKPNRECLVVARLVLQKELWVIPQNVYFFRSGAAEGVDWGGHNFYKKIGGHCFYREPSYGRNSGIPPALYERTYKYAQYGCTPENRVYRIQFMLDALGYDIEKVDKYFGESTKEALIKFQQDHGLDDDGVAGPAAVRKLIEEYGARNYYAKFCT